MILDWIAAGMEISGSWVLGNKKIIGFYLYIAAAILWSVIAIQHHIYGMLLCTIPAFFINIRNILKWRKDAMHPE